MAESLQIFNLKYRRRISRKGKVKALEIRINKEIKDYHESLFFGLSMRQFVCSVAAVGATTSITNLIVNLFVGLSVGSGVAVAQAIGK